jgi:hypothetical protein
MAGCLSCAGVELRIYDDTRETNRIGQRHLVANVMTGRKVGASDECAEIRELYLAPDEANLFGLLTAFPPVNDTSVCINTSAASRNVLVRYVDSNGDLNSKEFTSVVAEGSRAAVPTQSGPSIPLLIFHTISVTDADLDDEKNSGHPLFKAFRAGDDEVKKLTPVIQERKQALRSTLRAGR